MNLLKNDLYRLPTLLVGFIIMSTGIVLLKNSNLGLFAWGVFHDGLSIVTGLSFGDITKYLGLLILVFSVLAFKTKIGPGTLLSVLLVGWMIDFIDELFQFVPSNLLQQIIIFIPGLILINLGKAYYISSRLGSGPRDGMFVGLSRITKIDVKYIKPGIEIIVLIVGYFLGGVAGIGTIVTMLSSGYIIQYFFRVFGFNPKEDRQRSFFEYFVSYKVKKDTV